MQNLFDELTEVLSKDDRLVIEGKLAKNKIVELALKLDGDLLKLLLSNDTLKSRFFTDVEGTLVFDKYSFQRFVANKQFLPDSYTAFKNKIGLSDNGEDYLSEKNDVSLIWPYKDCVLEGGQTKEDAKRNEIFWNETLAPDEIDRLLDSKALTNFKKYNEEGEVEIDKFSLSDNFVFKGNNLLALHSLKKNYSGKVKLIYLDPPYNTGKDTFNYNDKFNHSSWLTFIRNRIEIARELLADNGVLVVQSDDKEQAYLKVLLDEIMGREQFETSFYIQVRYSNKTLSEDNDFQKVMEVAHVYSKNHSVFAPNKIKEDYSLEKFCYEINELKEGKKIQVGGKDVEIFKEGEYEIKKVEPHINGLKETWATGSLIRQGGTAAEFLSKYLIKRKKEDGLKVLYKIQGMGEDGLGYRYVTGPKKKTAKRGKFYSGVPTSIKDGVISGEYNKELPIPNLIFNFLQYEGDFGNCRHEGGVDIGGGKKPEALIKYFIEYFTNEEDLVIDMFSGSGTTAAVAHKMNRKYIVGEQLESHLETTIKRLKNCISGDKTGISEEVDWKGGGSFVYAELIDFNTTFINKISESKTENDLTEVWNSIKDNAFISYKVDPETVNKEKDSFEVLSIEEKRKFLIEVLDKNQLYVNYTDIEDEDFDIPDDIKELNRQFYSLSNK